MTIYDAGGDGLSSATEAFAGYGVSFGEYSLVNFDVLEFGSERIIKMCPDGVYELSSEETPGVSPETTDKDKHNISMSKVDVLGP